MHVNIVRVVTNARSIISLDIRFVLWASNQPKTTAYKVNNEHFNQVDIWISVSNNIIPKHMKKYIRNDCLDAFKKYGWSLNLYTTKNVRESCKIRNAYIKYFFFSIILKMCSTHYLHILYV